MPGLFDAARMVTAEQAARRYGVRFRGRRAFCPFHDDGRHPALSFKDARFTCFACGAHGDSIDLVQQLFSLSNIGAARLLSDGFGLGLTDQPIDWRLLGERRREQADRREKAMTIALAHDALCWAWRYLRDRAPETDRRFNGAYPQLLRHVPVIGHILDTLEAMRTDDERYDLLFEFREVVDGIDRIRRITDSSRQSLEDYRGRVHSG